MAPSAYADVYALNNGKGVIHFTNVPNPGDKRFQRVLHIPKAVSTGKFGARKTNEPVRAVVPGRDAYREDIASIAKTYRVDEALIKAVIQAESGFRPAAVSHKGAMGLMQLMPATARRYGVEDPYDPAQNIHGGTRYLRDLLDMFNNNPELAVAAYNAGENAVIRHGHKIPPYRETLDYVPKVMAIYEKLRTGM
jgi:soluble lytic murein transglycosylase-like protein